MGRLSVGAARAVLKLWPAQAPDPEAPAGLQEIFDHPCFRQGSQGARLRVMEASSRWKLEEEEAYPWDNYFGVDLSPLLQGRKALDLGCFTGGRSVAWLERYGLAEIAGVDVNPAYVDAAKRFASSRSIPGNFRVSRGESLPFDTNSFDAVLTFDVLEHVQDVRATLHECHRVLRPGGVLVVAFPGYYHPAEHHLGFVTRLPGVHYLFSGATLVEAYWQILRARGPKHAWYARSSPHLEGWERGNTINGMTVGRFRDLVYASGWRVTLESRRPVLGTGRNVTRYPVLRALGYALAPLARIPVIEEVLLHRIAWILEKQGEPGPRHRPA